MLSIPDASPLTTRNKSGPKPKDRPITVPLTQHLSLNEQDRHKQADYVRSDAYTLSRLFNRDLLQAIRDKDKIGMKDKVIAWGIASDKVLSGVESTGIDLHVPAALIDKIVLGLNVKRDVPPPVDIQQLP